MSQLVPQFSVHPTQIHRWKKQLLAGASELFHDGRTARENPTASFGYAPWGSTG